MMALKKSKCKFLQNHLLSEYVAAKKSSLLFKKPLMYSKEQRINLLQVDESDICSSCLLTYDFAHGIKTSITYVSDFISESYLKEIRITLYLTVNETLH